MMKPLLPEEMIPAAEYERQREAFRRRIIALKQRRRMSIGPLITLVFENRETLQFQIQEMVRVEQIVDPAKVQEELDVYNALLPATGELSATLLIEITDEANMKQWLDAFMGLDHGQKVAIVAGDERVFGEFEGGHSHETKISAVHFVRFRPTASMKAAFADLRQPVSMTVQHGDYRAEAPVSGSMREEWLLDLAGC
ncbi:MAG: DUF3501 family protein [Nitrospira sp.]|jgi:hypothetical protein|nr:DUF3501 family protein [Nitrospira sp.]